MISGQTAGPSQAVSAAILAGGRNRRMGTNKAFIEFGGKSLLQLTIDALRPLFPEIRIIGNSLEEYSTFGLPVTPDIRPGIGSLGGIHTALVESSAPWVFCTACDMPFLKPAVAAYLTGLADDGIDVVIPRLTEGMEPLCAVYSKNIIPAVEDFLSKGNRKIIKALDAVRVRIVPQERLIHLDPELLTFLNVNTPGDLEDARRKMEALCS